MLTHNSLQRWFEYSWGHFSFSQSNIIKIANVEIHLKVESWFANNDLPKTEVIEQALSKSACQRNLNLTASDARIEATTQY